MSAWVETHRELILPTDLDGFGHLGIEGYQKRLVRALGVLYASSELPVPQLIERGLAFVAVEQKLEFRAELRAGDVLCILSGWVELERKISRVMHRVVEGLSRRPVLTALQTNITFSLTERRSIETPADIAAAIRRLVLTREEHLNFTS